MWLLEPEWEWRLAWADECLPNGAAVAERTRARTAAEKMDFILN